MEGQEENVRKVEELTHLRCSRGTAWRGDGAR
jgi:hypothetical protein